MAKAKKEKEVKVEEVINQENVTETTIEEVPVEQVIETTIDIDDSQQNPTVIEEQIPEEPVIQEPAASTLTEMVEEFKENQTIDAEEVLTNILQDELNKDSEIIEEVNTLPEPEIEEISNTTIEKAEKLTEEVINDVPSDGKPLSAEALRWKKYLEYQKVTPEQFLKKTKEGHPAVKYVKTLLENKD